MTNVMKLAAIILLASGVAVQAASVVVVDGDSLRIDGKSIRLQGIDAPELMQDCRNRSGKSWRCGLRARTELRNIIGRHAVQCEDRAKDRYGRTVAVCMAGGQNIGEAMVRAGYAEANKGRGGSPGRYADVEDEARAAKRGIWEGSFTQPGEWRQTHPRDKPRPPKLPHQRDQEEPILSAEAKEWLRQRSDAARQAVSRWWRSVWTPEPRRAR